MATLKDRRAKATGLQLKMNLRESSSEAGPPTGNRSGGEPLGMQRPTPDEKVETPTSTVATKHCLRLRLPTLNACKKSADDLPSSSAAPLEPGTPLPTDLKASEAFAGAPYQDDPIEILPGLYLGSEKNASVRDVLQRNRIRGIINVGIECRNHFEAVPSTTLEGETVISEVHDQGRRMTVVSKSSAGSEDLDSLPLSPLYNPLNIAGASTDHAAAGSTEYSAGGGYRSRSPRRTLAESSADEVPSAMSSLPSASPKRRKSGTNAALASIITSLDTSRLLHSPTSEHTSEHTSDEVFVAPEYLRLPWTHNQGNIQAYFDDAFAFLDRFRNSGSITSTSTSTSVVQTGNSADTKVGVLVHCKQGVSRSASLVIAYVMRELHMSFQDAYAFVKEKSPNITPNMSLVYQLLEFERTLGLGSRG